MRIGFDSNILVYLAGGERVEADRDKIRIIQRLVLALAPIAELVAPVQSMAEALHVLIHKFGNAETQIVDVVLLWESSFEVVPSSLEVLRAGIGLAALHRLRHWDAIIVAASAAGNCEILLSEDMQHGFVWRGLTIVNPFAAGPHPLLASLLT